MHACNTFAQEHIRGSREQQAPQKQLVHRVACEGSGGRVRLACEESDWYVKGQVACGRVRLACEESDWHVKGQTGM